MPNKVFNDNGEILPGAGDSGLIELVLTDARGVYIPRDFADMYGTEYGVTDDDLAILLDGPDNDHYWDVWHDVLDYAEYQDDNGHTWRLYQDSDLFIYRHTDFDTTAYVCADCAYADANGMSDVIASMVNSGIDPDTVPVPLNRFDDDDTVEHYAANYDPETGDGITTFSKSPCDGCGTHYAGYRYRYALWLTE